MIDVWTLRLCALLSLVQGVSCSAQQIRSDAKDGRYWFRTMILPPDQIVGAQMGQIARRFLQEALPNRSMVVLSAFSSVEQAGFAQAASRDSYRQWRVYYDQAIKERSPAAEMTAIQGNAVMVIRRADGGTTREIMAGRDPFHFHAGEAGFEIILARPRRTTIFDRCKAADLFTPTLYVTTPATITASLSEQGAKRIASLLGTENFHVELRNDHWFLSTTPYPIVDLYSLNLQPPSEQDYRSSVQFTCGKLCGDEKMTCIQTLGFDSEAKQ